MTSKHIRRSRMARITINLETCPIKSVAKFCYPPALFMIGMKSLIKCLHTIMPREGPYGAFSCCKMLWYLSWLWISWTDGSGWYDGWLWYHPTRISPRCAIAFRTCQEQSIMKYKRLKIKLSNMWQVDKNLLSYKKGSHYSFLYVQTVQLFNKNLNWLLLHQVRFWMNQTKWLKKALIRKWQQ